MRSTVRRIFKRNPLLFGIPFIVLIVGASFGLQNMTQLRYDVQKKKVQELSDEQQLAAQTKLKRRKFDIREEYFRMQDQVKEDWENVRVPRPKGLPEWGVAPENPARLPDSPQNTRPNI